MHGKREAQRYGAWGRRLGLVAIAVSVAVIGAGCIGPNLADPHGMTTGDVGGSGDLTYGTGNCLFNVSYVAHPSLGGASSTLNGQRITGDALPGGPGTGFAQPEDCSKGDPSKDVWAPSVILYGGKYIMHYTAAKPGGQRCIGRATATKARGPFTPASEWACPPQGRWAIDPGAFVGLDGQLYVAYRDDYAVPGQDPCKTAISIVRTNANGEAIWSTRRTALLSDDVTWEKRGAASSACPSRVRIVENPSIAISPSANGHYYLFFSTGKYNSAQYANGVADCGTNPVGPGRCTIAANNGRPYWGHSSMNPYFTLPGDHWGPGGMSIYWSFGSPSGPTERRVVWHWYHIHENKRYVRNAELVWAGGYGWVIF